MSTYLLAIGINHYTDRAFRALSCCENDASEIHALFKRNLELGDRASKLVGAVSIADVKNELRRIGQEIRNGDTFVLFFAGHGYQHPKREDQFLLFPEAEARLVNKGYLDGMLSLSALCELTEHWAGVARVFILDACRSWLPGRDASGARFDSEAALAYIASRDPAFGPDNCKPTDSLNAPGGALPPVILNATRNGQEAKELEDRQRGVLALALEQALESQHKSGEVIWLGEQMLTDVNQRMNTLLQHGRLGVEQTPFLTPPSARVLLFKPQRITETPTNDDDETEWAITCAKQSIEAYESYARRKPPGKHLVEALRCIGEIASNDASRDGQAIAERDESRRDAQFLAAKIKNKKSVERTDKGKDETPLPVKTPSRLGLIVGALILCGAVIAFFSGDSNDTTPAASLPPLSEQTDSVQTQPSAAEQHKQISSDKGATRSPGYDIAMVRIPSGSFTMGSPLDELSRENNEGPQRTVQIRTFEIGKYEVTQDQWKAVMGSNPSYFSKCGGDCPVDSVSWDMAQAFIKKLNARTGSNYRLPSEAEWEYAARAGTANPFSFAGPITAKKANYDANHQYDGSPTGDFRKGTIKTGSLPGNSWGLHEVHGNVWEWVQDCWHDSYIGAPEDGRAWESVCTENAHVLRGGSWGDAPRNLRSAARSSFSPDNRGTFTGFRLARTTP